MLALAYEQLLSESTATSPETGRKIVSAAPQVSHIIEHFERDFRDLFNSSLRIACRKAEEDGATPEEIRVIFRDGGTVSRYIRDGLGCLSSAEFYLNNAHLDDEGNIAYIHKGQEFKKDQTLIYNRVVDLVEGCESSSERMQEHMLVLMSESCHEEITDVLIGINCIILKLIVLLRRLGRSLKKLQSKKSFEHSDIVASIMVSLCDRIPVFLNSAERETIIRISCYPSIANDNIPYGIDEVERSTALEELKDDNKSDKADIVQSFEGALDRNGAIEAMKKAQADLGLSHREFAKRFGLNATVLGDIYSGRSSIEKTIEVLGKAGYGLEFSLVKLTPDES